MLLNFRRPARFLVYACCVSARCVARCDRWGEGHNHSVVAISKEKKWWVMLLCTNNRYREIKPEDVEKVGDDRPLIPIGMGNFLGKGGR